MEIKFREPQRLPRIKLPDNVADAEPTPEQQQELNYLASVGAKQTYFSSVPYAERQKRKKKRAAARAARKRSRG
ncbi:hypothetical protein CH300_19960 [Rhodococcus sp. 15-1154-1]|nr:hypothetical protein [Rhodococcus sp. 15-1154-1]OZF00820.1 hypothetical protein CH300_19960 [Rhodococcus sp. 15-1154-1]